MNITQPECIWPLAATLGEGPVWHAEDNALYFVDIKQRAIHRCEEDGSRRQSWTVPEEVGFALPIHGGGFVCGLPGRLMRFSFDSGELTPLLELEADLPGNRLNDGYVDRHGCLWFGSMDNAEMAPSGSLYRLCEDQALERKDSGYVITNGPCVSPDGRTFYHTDTLEKTVYAFDVDDQAPWPTSASSSASKAKAIRTAWRWMPTARCGSPCSPARASSAIRRPANFSIRLICHALTSPKSPLVAPTCAPSS
jgi:D-xylonolactonase